MVGAVFVDETEGVVAGLSEGAVVTGLSEGGSVANLMVSWPSLVREISTLLPAGMGC